ncbi:DUF86 domain-containing protein [Weissella diestrammenae]|uniref:DUF86 domain-containing protein n=1 Tax=Weissella diestrammenae TaxID=1162633 RepID=A0A7G9T3Q0_9LACO|nr:HepT-like ribonuclease domain-containing protein [Weissella diestrammenae]MCM0582707.1 DUF86 domain-containing protein [Weissella diestrammenae]QNN74725.1 DUF86 domain-containing protein [Weissella diestrammenae]
MSNNKDIRYLESMLIYLDQVNDIASSKPMDLIITEYGLELSSILMKLTQVGELVGRLSFNTIEEYPDVPWRELKGLRNVIVHEYEDIRLQEIKNIILNNIPDTEEQLRNVLQNEIRKSY